MKKGGESPLSAAVGTLCWVLAAARTTENSESHQVYSGDITSSATGNMAEWFCCHPSPLQRQTVISDNHKARRSLFDVPRELLGS